ncbi:MAG: hypothetical protein CL607_08365 [Anaerolineaceae bacterium]|nr:hypothetical protein [Anaerolineaceae bacterium]
MRRSTLRTLLAIFLIVFTAGVAWLMIAPPTTDITVRECVTGADDACLTLPRVMGDNLNGETITLPDDISSEYALLVVPFDREQQTQAANWLPVYQDIVAEHDNLSYYSVAILVVEAPFRPLVVGGLNVAIVDPEVRQAVMIAFVEESDQQDALTALNHADEPSLLALLVNQQGEVLWQHAGVYEPSAADELRTVITNMDGN